MRVVARAAVLGLVGVSALGAAGCNRGGGTGATTVIQQTVVSSGSSSSGVSSTSVSVASVAPIDDPKELCHQIFIKTRGLSTALSSFWKIATKHDGWSYTDQDAQDAISRVEKELGQVFPALDNIVGHGVPNNIADPANDYLKKMKEFSNAITEQRTDETLNPDASNFGDAKDILNSACNSAG